MPTTRLGRQTYLRSDSNSPPTARTGQGNAAHEKIRAPSRGIERSFQLGHELLPYLTLDKRYLPPPTPSHTAGGTLIHDQLGAGNCIHLAAVSALEPNALDATDRRRISHHAVAMPRGSFLRGQGTNTLVVR